MPNLSELDEKLIDYLFKYKTASSYQIHRDIYSGVHKSKKSTRVHLCRLIKRGYIHNRYNRFLEHIKHYGLTKTSILTNRSSLINREIIDDENGLPTNSYCSTHDMTLIEIWRNILKDSQVKEHWTENEYHFKSCKRAKEIHQKLNGINPDGVILYNINGKDFLLALEFERTLKTDDRYYDLLNRYHNNKEIGGVIYICEQQHILKKIKHFENHVFGGKRNATPFFFIRSKDFFNSSSPCMTDFKGHRLFIPKTDTRTAYIEDNALTDIASLNLFQNLKIITKTQHKALKNKLLSGSVSQLNSSNNISTNGVQ